MSSRGRQNGLTIVGLAFFIFMILNVLKDQGWLGFSLDPNAPSLAAVASHLSTPRPADRSLQATPAQRRIELTQPDATTASPQAGEAPVASTAAIDSNAIAPPYKHYILTQGPHDFQAGEMAIDIADGKGATILSPINGWVSNFYIDDLGNTTLLLENDRYIVELLHGLYTVKVGEAVTLGQPIGKESNQGNTADPNGVSCRGRDCGYHTHINIFDKSLGTNVNPLDLFPAQQ
jgi:hypothetical protein